MPKIGYLPPFWSVLSPVSCVCVCLYIYKYMYVCIYNHLMYNHLMYIYIYIYIYVYISYILCMSCIYLISSYNIYIHVLYKVWKMSMGGVSKKSAFATIFDLSTIFKRILWIWTSLQNDKNLMSVFLCHAIWQKHLIS